MREKYDLKEIKSDYVKDPEQLRVPFLYQSLWRIISLSSEEIQLLLMFLSEVHVFVHIWFYLYFSHLFYPFKSSSDHKIVNSGEHNDSP